jgi:hypothetical protein
VRLRIAPTLRVRRCFECYGLLADAHCSCRSGVRRAISHGRFQLSVSGVWPDFSKASASRLRHSCRGRIEHRRMSLASHAAAERRVTTNSVAAVGTAPRDVVRWDGACRRCADGAQRNADAHHRLDMVLPKMHTRSLCTRSSSMQPSRIGRPGDKVTYVLGIQSRITSGNCDGRSGLVHRRSSMRRQSHAVASLAVSNRRLTCRTRSRYANQPPPCWNTAIWWPRYVPAKKVGVGSGECNVFS